MPVAQVSEKSTFSILPIGESIVPSRYVRKKSGGQVHDGQTAKHGRTRVRTLTQFMGLRKMNTIGLEQANKCTQLSAIAYTLKKYLKFAKKRSKSGATMLALAVLAKSIPDHLFGSSIKYQKMALHT